jgi:hypothetical protein
MEKDEQRFERRRLALQQILDERFGGRVVDLARLIGKDPSYVSRMLYPVGKSGRKRIGDEMVEHIETCLRIPRGTLDGIASGSSQPPVDPQGRGIRPIVVPDDVTIPQFDTGGMGGHGLVLQDQPGIIENWQVSREWANSNIPSCTSFHNLCIVTGFGDSMPDAFNPGDPVIVDMGIRTCTHDGIYFFRVGNEGFIKILQRIPGVGIMAISQNKNYRDWAIRDDMDFQVFGKVLKAWKGKNY